jgi:acetate CoA/acetoacetate CoA-transferase beta subunit
LIIWFFINKKEKNNMSLTATTISKEKQVEIIAKRVALELKDGNTVNLGIGIPTEVANYIPKGINICLASENGIVRLGGAPAAGEEHPDIINAGGGFLTEVPGTCYIDSATSFALVRGGHIDVTVLGVLEVCQKGDIANWIIPGKMVPGMGGAMDLCVGAKRVIAAFTHTDKNVSPKILKKCRLPLTAKGVVKLIVTDMAVMEPTPEGMLLKEVAYWTTVEEVKRLTEAELIIPDNIKTFGK